MEGFSKAHPESVQKPEPELPALSLSPPSVGPLEEKVGNRLELVGTGKDSSEQNTEATGIKTNNQQTGPHEAEKLLYSK